MPETFYEDKEISENYDRINVGGSHGLGTKFLKESGKWHGYIEVYD